MIVPDVNLLVYAYNEAAPLHGPARAWWEGLLSKAHPIGMPWAVALGFIRLVTHPRVLDEPLSPSAALDRVEAWLARPEVQIIDPGPRHLSIVRALFRATGAASLTTDAQIAALPSSTSAVHSNDSDFGRYPVFAGGIRSPPECSSRREVLEPHRS
jgi:toxin-antitoxin system PIN domain toxin